MKRLKLTWWHWVILILFVIIAFTYGGLAAIRIGGLAKYDETIQELTAKNKLTSVDDYIDALPPVDISLYDNWEKWCRSVPEYPNENQIDASLADELVKIYEKDQKFISDLQTQVNDLSSAMSHGVTLVNNPDLVLSTHGLLAILPKGKRDAYAMLWSGPNLLGAKSLMYWLHDEAVLSSKPHSALAVQDRLVAALQPPAFLDDSMTLSTYSRIRDETYLHCSLLGTLSDEDRNRWLAEPCNFIHQIGETFRVYCLCVLADMDFYRQQSYVHFVFGGGMEKMDGILPSSNPVDPLKWSNASWTWATHPRNSATLLTTYIAMSDRFSGQSHEDHASLQVRIKNNCEREMRSLEYQFQICCLMVDADAQHRLFRFAVQLIEYARTHKLPATHADLLVQFDINNIIAPPGDHLHLIYERLSPRRFRVVVNPSSPVPNFEDGSEMTRRTIEYGEPANEYPLFINRTSIEVELFDVKP